jgi:uncharacterized membrane protein YhaH (DUF805 family)
MSFPEAVRSVVTKYVGFSGRARRSEYWWFALLMNVLGWVFFSVMFFGVLTSLTEVGAPNHATALVTGGVSLVALVVADVSILALALPHMAVTVRRLHDTNRSGWFYLISFVPLIGSIMLLVVLTEDSTRGPNAYGPSPKYV